LKRNYIHRDDGLQVSDQIMREACEAEALLQSLAQVMEDHVRSQSPPLLCFFRAYVRTLADFLSRLSMLS
jgi:hypothetical protein